VQRTPVGGPPCHVAVAGATDIGRVRDINEDAYIISPLDEPDPVVRPRDDLSHTSVRPLLLAVSDGMGGAQAGEVASTLTLDALRRSLPGRSTDWSAALRDAVECANREVWRAGRDPGREGMGATLTAVCLHENWAYIAEVGDSRAYLLRDGEIRLLTHDQSYVQVLLDVGALKPDEAAHSPMKNLILAAMGHEADVPVDLGRVEVQVNDRLLLCSDGLSNELDAAEIRDVVAASATPAAACARLIAAANGHGGRDNITVIVAVFTVR
jgi:PPM family protein phosphatase